MTFFGAHALSLCCHVNLFTFTLHFNSVLETASFDQTMCLYVDIFYKRDLYFFEELESSFVANMM